MASTSFIDGITLIQASWLNDVNVATYTTIPNIQSTYAPLNSPTLITPNLGVATATSINGVTINTGVLSGTNTGDQLIFKNIAVSGQSTVVADTTSDTLTLAAGSGITITTNAATDTITVATSAASGIYLLSTTNVTATATIDLLSVFSSSYDRYLIIVDGVMPNAADTLNIRLATGGSADSGSNYYITAASATSGVISATAASGGVVNTQISITNCNRTSPKTIYAVTSTLTGAATYSNGTFPVNYVATNTVSGLRLYWNGGASFQAVGSIRVYGYANV